MDMEARLIPEQIVFWIKPNKYPYYDISGEVLL
jgi:hypothetical protein